MNNLTIRSSTSRAFIVAAFSLLIIFITLIFAVQTDAASKQPQAGERLITIHDRNHERSLLTDSSTLRDALREASIELDPNDRVEPSLDDKLVASHYEVNIYRARPVTIVDGAVRQRVMSSYQTPKQIAEQAGITLQDEDDVTIAANTNIVEQGAGLQLTVSRATEFTLVLYGTKTTAYTQGETVSDVLKEKGITLSSNDTLNVPLNAEVIPGMVVELWRNGKQTATVEQDVAFEVEKVQDVDQPVGYRKVTTPGEIGKRTVTYEIEMKNGQEVSRVEIQSVVTKEPKKQVETVGAKFKYTGGPLSEVQIEALGRCESGMTPTRNSGNGYYGAFQFSAATWRSYNKVYAYAHEAPLDVQKQAVQDLLSKSSIYTQFPSCAKKMQAQGII